MPRLEPACDFLLEVIDVEDVGVVDAMSRGLDVAGYGDVHEKERPAFALLHRALDHLSRDDVRRACRAGDDDVGHGKLLAKGVPRHGGGVPDGVATLVPPEREIGLHLEAAILTGG